jgi:hypothetical protein
MTVMGSHREQTERIEALRGLIERLSAPELTLAEAKDLRDRLSRLLERADRHGGKDRMAASPSLDLSPDWSAGPGLEAWSPGPSMRSAG